MELEEAQQQARNAAIAAYIVSGFSILYLSLTLLLGEEQISSPVDATFFLCNNLLIMGLGFSTSRFSRMSALILFVFYLINRILIVIFFKQYLGIIVAGVVLYYLWLGIEGTFEIHRIRKENDPHYKATRLLSTLLAVPSLIAVTMMLISIALELQRDPSIYMIRFGSELDVTSIEQIKTVDRFDEDERILCAYTHPNLSFSEYGTVLTDRRVMTYNYQGDRNENDSASFDDITNVRSSRVSGVDGAIKTTIEKASGESFEFFIPTFENRHDEFLNLLRRRIPKSED